MLTQEERNRILIDAILEKERRFCPGSIALIGIYGSFLTGDIHPRSDLDLLILINDDRGRQLAEAFLEDDRQVGHDLYCTSWESLREDAQYNDPNIAKLMDSEIVYCADEKARAELNKLREQVRRMLSVPLSTDDLPKAQAHLQQARAFFSEAMLSDDLNEMRVMAGGCLYSLENALVMLNKTYFRRGARHRLEELDALPRKPENLVSQIEAILAADSTAALRTDLRLLMKQTQAVFRQAAASLTPAKRPADAEILSGTYEEMFSNWRNKLTLAAETGDRYLAFMSLVSCAGMLKDIEVEAEIGKYDPVSLYDPQDLRGTAERFDAMLDAWLREYEKAGLSVNRYPNAQTFVRAYLET